jgi:NADH-quinone oxidoreductase subunit N
MTPWIIFSPELYYFLSGLVFLGLSLTPRTRPGRDYFIGMVLAGVGVVVCLAAVRMEGLLFFKAYRVDLFSQVFKVMLSLGLFLVVSLCSELKAVEQRLHPEFYLLVFVCTLAMMMLVSILPSGFCLHPGHDDACQLRTPSEYLRCPGIVQLFALYTGFFA